MYVDNLQGFRHYRIIIETLLHELVHMQCDEHDENFHSLNRQLNKVAYTIYVYFNIYSLHI